MYFYSQYFRNSYFRSQYFVKKYFYTYVCSGQLILDGTYIKILDGKNVLIKSNNCLNTDLIYDVYDDYYKNLNKLINITEFDQTHENELLTNCQVEDPLAKKKEYYNNTLDKLNKLKKIVYINK